jgi:hypothetical protein
LSKYHSHTSLAWLTEILTLLTTLSEVTEAPFYLKMLSRNGTVKLFPTTVTTVVTGQVLLDRMELLTVFSTGDLVSLTVVPEYWNLKMKGVRSRKGVENLPMRSIFWPLLDQNVPMTHMCHFKSSVDKLQINLDFNPCLQCDLERLNFRVLVSLSVKSIYQNIYFARLLSKFNEKECDTNI